MATGRSGISSAGSTGSWTGGTGRSSDRRQRDGNGNAGTGKATTGRAGTGTGSVRATGTGSVRDVAGNPGGVGSRRRVSRPVAAKCAVPGPTWRARLSGTGLVAGCPAGSPVGWWTTELTDGTAGWGETASACALAEWLSPHSNQMPVAAAPTSSSRLPRECRDGAGHGRDTAASGSPLRTDRPVRRGVPVRTAETAGELAAASSCPVPLARQLAAPGAQPSVSLRSELATYRH